MHVSVRVGESVMSQSPFSSSMCQYECPSASDYTRDLGQTSSLTVHCSLASHPLVVIPVGADDNLDNSLLGSPIHFSAEALDIEASRLSGRSDQSLL